MLTKKQAFKLQPGDILVDKYGKRWKVNGIVQTWKKPENKFRIRVPLKHGLYSYEYIDEDDFDENDKCYWLEKSE